METLRKLYKTLNQRKRPEDVAEMILEILGKDLTPVEEKILKKAAKGSLKKMFWGYTSMTQEFAEAIGAERQIKKAIEIFQLQEQKEIDYDDVVNIKAFIEEVSPLIHKDVGANNFLTDRLDKFERKELGMEISKRNYNKKWRLLKRLEMKLLKFQKEIQKIEFQKIAKHGFAHHIDFEMFSQDINTACFIAYYNATSNRRSIFTNKRQARAFDEICDMLFDRCKGRRVLSKQYFGKGGIRLEKSQANWSAISYIYPSQEVLAQLTDEEKGQLLGQWTNTLEEIAQMLSQLWEENTINRETMIVQRGNDSSTWNHTAGAWNKARDNWMNLIYALGMEYVLEEVCFGKVMRLIAADVAWWHRRSGGNLDANTQVWNKLPLPWEVFRGEAQCNKKMVRKYCNLVEINAENSGWIAPRIYGVVQFKPTPELVHGVEVSNPFLATILKKHKYFSGKKVNPVHGDLN